MLFASLLDPRAFAEQDPVSYESELIQGSNLRSEVNVHGSGHVFVLLFDPRVFADQGPVSDELNFRGRVDSFRGRVDRQLGACSGLQTFYCIGPKSVLDPRACVIQVPASDE